MTITGLSEDSLIQTIKQGEYRSFYKIIEGFSERAYHYVWHLVRDSECADDLCKTAFLKAYQLAKNSTIRMPLRIWFYRILTNCYLEIRKKGKKLNLNSVKHHQTEVHVSLGQEAIVQEVERLTDTQKAMIVLYHSEKLSLAEIAQVLDLPVNVLKRRLDHVHLVLARRCLV